MSKDVTSGIGNNPQDYQQQRYRSLDQAWVNWREQRILAQLLRQCQLTNSTVLDVPCGYSRFAPLYARLGITAIGADVSYDMAHLAAANHARHGLECWLCADVLALPFTDSVFDSVLCIRLLHHRYQRRRTTADPLRTRPGVASLCHHQLLSVHTAPYRGTPLARFPRPPGHDDHTALAGPGAGQRAANSAGALSPAFLSRANLRSVDQNLLCGRVDRA